MEGGRSEKGESGIKNREREKKGEKLSDGKKREKKETVKGVGGS